MEEQITGNEIIKDTIPVGNSAGVLLPKKWLNSRVKVILEPLNVEKDVLEILMNENLLKNTLGAYIIGSYARKEQTIESDVDILILTDNIEKRIIKGKYDILCIPEKEIKNQLEKNALPLLAMIKEAKSIINGDLITKYLGSQLTKKNLNWHIDTTKSAMNVVREFIKLAEEMGERVSDAVSYSLILRFRTLYIIDCLRKNRLWKKKEFLDLVKKRSGSLTAYERYLKSKNKNSHEDKLPVEEAKRLMDYINKEVREIEEWIKN